MPETIIPAGFTGNTIADLAHEEADAGRYNTAAVLDVLRGAWTAAGWSVAGERGEVKAEIFKVIRSLTTGERRIDIEPIHAATMIRAAAFLTTRAAEAAMAAITEKTSAPEPEAERRHACGCAFGAHHFATCPAAVRASAWD